MLSVGSRSRTAIRADVGEAADRVAIYVALVRCCRGVDRRDPETVR